MRFCDAIPGILIPFLGTSVGAACVFGLPTFGGRVKRLLTGFAAGVMTAASVWSLILPALADGEALGRWSFVPATVGLWIGVLFLLGLDRLIARQRAAENRGGLGNTAMLVTAVVLHNLPEGMAVGAVLAGALAGKEGITLTAALTFAVGIGIQNVPEGAIVSLPLRAQGKSRLRSFGDGVLSGAVEPLGAALTLLLTETVVPLMPYLLGFAAGAMLYAVVADLIPSLAETDGSALGALSFTAGFCLMMALDVSLG